MIVDWIYGHPVWMVGTVIVVGTVVASCLGLLVVHAVFDRGLRRDHNDVVGATIGIVGTVTAILLAFIGVATWQTFSEANAIAEREASAVGNLYFDAAGLPADGIREQVQRHIRAYLEIVTKTEWPAQRHGLMDQKASVPGRSELLRINNVLAIMQPANAGQANIHAQMFTTLNDLFTARRTRIQAAHGHVPLVVWVIILLGTAASIGYTYLFGARSVAMHMAVTGSVAASLALVILLIVVTDYPFRGDVSVGTDAYDSVREAIDSFAATQ